MTCTCSHRASSPREITESKRTSKKGATSRQSEPCSRTSPCTSLQGCRVKHKRPMVILAAKQSEGFSAGRTCAGYQSDGFVCSKKMKWICSLLFKHLALHFQPLSSDELFQKLFRLAPDGCSLPCFNRGKFSFECPPLILFRLLERGDS
jgi:hypothetical protein